jgi:RimJ/RimL family protein N-acetyltransferase
MTFQMIIDAQILEGKHVRLEPVTEEHRAEIKEVLESDPDNWMIQTSSGIGEHFDGYWRKMIDTPRRIAFAIRDQASGRIMGTSSFIKVDPKHRTLEIGYTFFHPDYRGTAANPETKLLMLSQAFGAGALRVQFSVSAANARSQAAVLKLGAKKEGVIRNHRITWTGAKRDTALFSIIDEEWETVRETLRNRLAKQSAS